MTLVLIIAIPATLYWFVYGWTPTTRMAFALRVACWPIVFLSMMLGGPLSRAISGQESRYLMSLPEALMGVTGLSVILAPIAFGIGYAMGKARFPARPQPPS